MDKSPPCLIISRGWNGFPSALTIRSTGGLEHVLCGHVPCMFRFSSVETYEKQIEEGRANQHRRDYIHVPVTSEGSSPPRTAINVIEINDIASRTHANCKLNPGYNTTL
jgi:hypothetical protein